MKASLKFRDDQKPLIRAKLPLNILNFPFQSGVVAGHSKELSLHLSTFFDSGPSLKLAYNPNDASNPFTFVVKTGTGKYGSPIDSSMVMSAEFNLVNNCGNSSPSFFVKFKPKFGDFGIRKKQGSSFVVGEGGGDDLIEVVGRPGFEFPGMRKIKSLGSAASVADRLLKDVEVNAGTSLPVLSFANVRLNWGLRFPTEMKSMVNGKNDGLVMNRPPTVSFNNIPFLVMNKISVEHVRGGNGKVVSGRDTEAFNGAVKDDDGVSKMCLGVRHQLDALRDENGMLRKAVEDLKQDFSSGKMNPFAGQMKHRDVSRGVGNKTMECRDESRLGDNAVEDVKKH